MAKPFRELFEQMSPDAQASVEARVRESLAELGEQTVVLTGISWALYEAVSATRGDSSGVRMTYRGATQELELVSPGELHETTHKKLARIVEAYADATGIDLDGIGSWTLKREGSQAVEADECYRV